MNNSLLQRFYFVTLSILLSVNNFAISQDKLVGLTSHGGPNYGGTAFSMLSDGTNFKIHNAFHEGGNTPMGSLFQDTDGNLYGMNSSGGFSLSGTIFKINTSGKMTMLNAFINNVDAKRPVGNLIKASDGNFYAMTPDGGANSYGTIFRLAPTGAMTILVHLDDFSKLGSEPRGSLLQGKDGKLYGMTSKGSLGYGAIFSMTLSGQVTVLKQFELGSSGGSPMGNLIQGTDSAFYGMCVSGGAFDAGTVFRITTSGVFTVLRHLSYNTTGAGPRGSLVQATDGYLYGITYQGGSKGAGTIFRLKPTGSDFKVLKELDYVTGASASGNLIQGKDGNFYGMTQKAGANMVGTIFKFSVTSNTISVLKNFNADVGPASTGHDPYGSLIQGSDGAFYGMTSKGGIYEDYGGTIFKITTSGAFTVLFRFPDNGDGTYSSGSLLQAIDGKFYGTAETGGIYKYGTVFKLCTDGSYNVLHSFDGQTAGNPVGNVFQAMDGNFYGMTSLGGTYNYGTIYKLTPGGTLSIIKSFDYNSTGYSPVGNLVQGPDSCFYGMTSKGGMYDYGTIFKITPRGTYTVLRHLDYPSSGGSPYGSLTQGADGYYYGMTSLGGSNYYGTIFKINATGTFSVIKNFDNALSGGRPYGSNLVQGRDGYFYGMTNEGGIYGLGTIFKINATGTDFKVLVHLEQATTGGSPKGSLVQGTDGSFYGMTSVQGAVNSAGTIFRMTAQGDIKVLRRFSYYTDGGTPIGSFVIQKANPKAAAQSVTAKEDSVGTIVLNGTGGAPFSYSVSTAPKNGTLSGTGATRTYKPKPNFNGRDSFYFKVTWGCQASSSAKVLISVSQVNDTPVLAPIGNKTVLKGATLKFTATATDVDSMQTRMFSLIGAPSGASIGASTGVFSWLPAATGTYTFTVKVSDNGSPALYDLEKITVTVNATASMAGGNLTLNSVSEGKLTIVAMPNPSATSFALVLKGGSTASVNLKVFDALGQVVETREAVMPNQALQIGQQYKSGTYMIEVQQGSEWAYVKLVKQ